MTENAERMIAMNNIVAITVETLDLDFLGNFLRLPPRWREGITVAFLEDGSSSCDFIDNHFVSKLCDYCEAVSCSAVWSEGNCHDLELSGADLFRRVQIV